LYWEGEIVMIDFPQAIDPQVNRSAYSIFERDVVCIGQYFEAQGIHSNPHKLAADLWARHNQRFVPLVDPKALPEDDDSERDIWESLKNT
jgi:serine/threonine-protein kinase RIO1